MHCPIATGWFLYAYLIRLLLLYMQFGRTGDSSMISSIHALFRRLGTAMLLSITIGGSACVILFAPEFGLALLGRVDRLNYSAGLLFPEWTFPNLGNVRSISFVERFLLTASLMVTIWHLK